MDYYTNWSFVIPLFTPEQVKWWEDLKEKPWENKEYVKSAENASYEIEEGDSFHGFEFEIENADPSQYAKMGAIQQVWLHDGCGQASEDVMTSVVRLFLREFKLKDAVVVYYSNTASRPVLDGNSGGAIIITADEIMWHSPHNWVDEQVEKHKKVQPEAHVWGPF